MASISKRSRRAAAQFATRGRIVSGGSTLTMQVARLLEPRKERSAAAKLRQMARALQLEQQYAKPIILDLYFILAPYGGNIEGVRAASLAYFGKEPKRLSVAEAALLVALPQAPEARRPDRFPARARAARDRVLERAYRRGVITLAERDEAMQQRRAARASRFSASGAACRRGGAARRQGAWHASSDALGRLAGRAGKAGA